MPLRSGSWTGRRASGRLLFLLLFLLFLVLVGLDWGSVLLVLVLVLVLGVLLLVEVLDVAVLALLVVGVVVLLDQLAVLDHAAPGARLELLHLDERLEAVQVGADGALDVAHSARGLLEQRAGVHVEVDLDPRQLGRELVEGHDAGVGDPLRDAST